MNEKMLLGVSEKPRAFKWLILSFQHVFAMFSATILVPLLTGLPVAVALFSSGVGTLIYILCTKAKVPVYLGSSFAYIAVVASVSGFSADPSTANYASALTGLFVVGIIYLVISIIIRMIGKSWIEKALPPIIVGPMIMIIGLGLSNVAISNAGLNGGDFKTIITAIVSFSIVVLVSLKAKGFLKVVPFLIGIIGGYIFASLIGIVDFSNFLYVLKSPGSWVKIPSFMFLGWKNTNINVLGTEITFYKMNFSAVLTIAPLAFVTAAEHIGDHTVLSKIVGKDFLKDPGLENTLMGDGLATAFASLIGGPANTTYGENTSVVGMTRVASVYVIGGAAVIAITLSFLNIFTTLISTVPTSVMGGISIILYGFIASNGLKVLIENKVDMLDLRNLIIIATMLVIGLGNAIISIGHFEFYGMSLAAIVGITLNLILPKDKKSRN
jgi:uracil permease